MMFIELFAPKGARSEHQRRHLGQQLIDVMSEESAPAAAIGAWRAVSQEVVHEPDTWIVGGRVVDPSASPRYVARVSVPGAWRKDMTAEIISRLTRVLAEADTNPERKI